jgi:hypothetical protein
MILTADRIPARTAETWGLVNFVVSHEALLDRAFALAGKIIEKSPLAVTACLGSVTRGLNVPIDEALQIEAGYFARMVPTQDMREGIAAWLARRSHSSPGLEDPVRWARNNSGHNVWRSPSRHGWPNVPISYGHARDLGRIPGHRRRSAPRPSCGPVTIRTALSVHALSDCHL